MPVQDSPDNGFPNNLIASYQPDPSANTDRLLMGGGSGYKSGRVVFATGFEGQAAGSLTTEFVPVGFLATQNGVVMAGNSPSIPNGSAQSWQGNNVLLLITQAVLNDTGYIIKEFPVGSGSMRVGLEFVFDMGDSYGIPSNGNLDLVIGGTMRLHWDASGVLTLQVANPSSFTTVPVNLPVSANIGAYNSIKLVVDLETGKYVRAYVNNVFIDLSAYTARTSAFPPGTIQSKIQLTTLNAAQKTVLLDNIILTADEP